MRGEALGAVTKECFVTTDTKLATSRFGEQTPAEVIIVDGHHLVPQVGFPELEGDGVISKVSWLVHEHWTRGCLPGRVYASAEAARSEARRCCRIKAMSGAVA